jgi:hypothetical protein
MLDTLEKRVGRKPGATVVVDRGMAYQEDLAGIRAHGYHYLVAGRQPERNAWLDDFEAEGDWEEGDPHPVAAQSWPGEVAGSDQAPPEGE